LERFTAEVEDATLADVQIVAEAFQAIRGGAGVSDLHGTIEVLSRFWDAVDWRSRSNAARPRSSRPSKYATFEDLDARWTQIQGS
jgi:hypothetical protein